MSVMGWRFFNVTKHGALESHNGEVWPPNEPLEATCRVNVNSDPAYYSLHRRMVVPKADWIKEEDASGPWVKLGADIKWVTEPCPVLNCTCGIYSYKDAELAWAYQTNPAAHRATTAFRVFGVIECWGGICEHELGWRAQFAQIRAVASVNPKGIHEVYNVPRYKIPAGGGFEALDDMIQIWGGGDE